MKQLSIISPPLRSTAATMLVSLVFAATLLTLTHPSHAQTANTLTLNAAGATFPAPLYQSWIASFREHHPDIHIT